MKRTNTYIPATLVLLLGFAACTQEDSMTDPGTTLFDGPYPLQIGTVTVSSEVSDGVQTRVAETNDGNSSVFETGDVITVSLNGETATYTFNGSSWTTDTQLYWTTAGQTLTAWYTSPDYTNGGTIDLSDQSNGLVYVLRATANFAQTVNLSFTHQLAKVRVVTTGTYDSSDSVLKLTATTECTVNEGMITDTDMEGTITMYQTNYDIGTCWEATVPGGTAISSVTIYGKTCTLDNTVTTEAGKLHTISLTVKVTGYTYNSTSNTYTVYTADGLLAWNQDVQNDLTLNCILAADIDLTDIEYTWLQVGDSDYPYTGTFEGGSHSITGLTIRQEGVQGVGLIGWLGSGGKVQNLTLEDMDIIGYRYVGSVVGYNDEGTVTSCSVSGSVYGSSYFVGGVVGCNYYGTVTACNASGSVSGNNSEVGGVVGENYGGIVAACYSLCNVYGSMNIGGVVGGNDEGGTVTACYHASGTVTGGLCGGVVGDNTSTVTACYWSSDVSNGSGAGSSSGTTKVGSDDCATWITAQTAMNTALANADSEWRYKNAGASSNADDAPTLTKSSGSQ